MTIFMVRLSGYSSSVEVGAEFALVVAFVGANDGRAGAISQINKIYNIYT